MSTEKRYRLIQADKIPWEAGRENGLQTKTLVDHGCGRLLLQVLRYSPGSTLFASAALPFQSALVVEGGAKIENESLGVWDFIRVPDAAQHGSIAFPEGATLLAVTLR